MRKQTCPLCKYDFSLKGGNYSKHIKACDGSYKLFVKLQNCKYCNISFENLNVSQRANHSKWCLKNPNRMLYVENMKHARSFISPENIKRGLEKIKQAHKNGAYKEASKKSYETKKKNGTLRHTEESKQLIRQKALASKHRRVLRSTREYTKKDGTVVLLDSSWEEALAKRLDEMNIEWERPKPVVWVDSEGKSHNYFPDFYLNDHDVYLDPKNDIVYNMSLEKINRIKTILPNLVILRSLDECKNFTI